MGIGDLVTERLIDSFDGGSLSARIRQRRWACFADAFPDLANMTVVDVGGDARSWRLSGLRPAHVTLLNIFEQDVAEEPWMTAMVGDACAPPKALPTADLVYSNSVIEHVGGHWRRERYAEGIRHIAERYWVQTPNRYFPVEPHFLCPALQYLPRAVQARVVAAWPLGHYRHVREPAAALHHLMRTELIGAAELGAYFPGAEIRRERFAGLAKALIAICR